MSLIDRIEAISEEIWTAVTIKGEVKWHLKA